MPYNDHNVLADHRSGFGSVPTNRYADHRSPGHQGEEHYGLPGVDIGNPLSSLNRGNNEFRGVDERSNYGVPQMDKSFAQRQQLADQYGQQGSSFRGNQGHLINMLEQRAAGQGPSMADMQMQRGLQGALAQQQALAASGRGNPAMAARQAAMNSGNIAGNLAGQGAMARVAEVQGAQNMLGNVLQGARGQDINQNQVNNASQLGALGQQMGLQGMQQQGQFERERNRTSRFNALTGTPTTGEQAVGMGSSLLAGLI